jgi:hypothetical protein
MTTLLRPEVVAKALAVSRTTVLRLVRSGELASAPDVTPRPLGRRRRQATKSPSAGRPPPRVPHRRLSWADGVLGTKRVLYPHEAQVSCRRYHGDAVQGGSRRHTVVVGHDAVELVTQFQSCRKMESVQAPQLFGVKGGRPFKRGGGDV